MNKQAGLAMVCGHVRIRLEGQSQAEGRGEEEGETERNEIE